MVLKKHRIPGDYSSVCRSKVSGRIDTGVTVSEGSMASRKKWKTLNSSTQHGFSVPTNVIRLSKLSLSERKNLVLQLKSELGDIQILLKKLESLEAKPVAVPSNEILSTQKGPPVQNFSQFLENSSSLGQKPRGWNRGTSGRFESLKRDPEQSNTNSMIFKKCEGLLRKLMTQKGCEWFNQPVDIVKLNIPDYFTIIKQPMDLGTVKKNLTSGQYSSPLDFAADVRLTFSNAMTYNPPGNIVHTLADTLSKFFEVRWKPIQKMVHVNSAKPAEENPALHEEFEMTKTVSSSKKRKLSPVHHTASPEPLKQSMTAEEKQKLNTDLEALQGDLPDHIIEFLKGQSSNGAEVGEDEIEIDFDVLSDDTMFKLRKLLDDFLQNKQSEYAKAEPCEIELQNDSGFSNSSMQVDKGNELEDEEIDIGGNEPPVSSYPPVKIERNVGEETNDCVNADDPSSNSESDSGSDHVHEQGSQQKANSSDSEGQDDGESTQDGRPVSPERLYRAAVLKNRFADTILKAREKTLVQGEKGDPEKLKREREELEMQKKKEKARLQAEAKAAEEVRKRAEEEAAAEAKRKRELEREAARQALLKMEKTVEINENSRFLEDLEMLSGVGHPEHLLSSADETSPEHLQDGGLGSFKFGGGNNPLEQLGLYMKVDDEDECEALPPPKLPNDQDSLEEGETE
ncbi:PREDICTED: transcription factor GTE8-like isoform X2 [Ipomoea nil]|uniref:transcription factor GTE8-like isoform X2 n=1 Tax=Ipomoea nil TaxID=35883 RepID=UPI00090135B3|nr:PREDICTED: transcription factor GTE8-like isoform X2 [Ipomoea nil]